MRKILMAVVVLLLAVLGGLIIFNGLSIGNFKILSAKQIIEENDKLTTEISDTEVLMNSVYPSKTEELDTSVSKLLTAEEEYLDLANVSTKAELNKASVVETYTVEFLWTRLGRHATAEGVNLSYTPSGKSINFTVVGEYIPILSFVSAIENDSKLGFTIENFKLVPNGENLQATFVTRNVNIKTESVSANVNSKSTTQNNTNSTNENKNTNDTTTQSTNENQNSVEDNTTVQNNETANQTQAQ